METSASIKELATALAKAQKEFQPAKKDQDNPFFKSKYADHAAVWEAIKAPLAANGLSVSQGFITINQETILTTILMHTSGEWLKSSITIKPMKPDPQGFGSCITYFRRYALAAICNVSQEDDDGNAASQPATPKASATAKGNPTPAELRDPKNWPGSPKATVPPPQKYQSASARPITEKFPPYNPHAS